MSELSSKPVEALFNHWRTQGDAPAGQAMAQRVSDWFYAVTTCRLGDAHGREPLQRACVRFQQGILGVNTPAELTEWSHGLLMEEVQKAGGRIGGGDFPNQLTTGRSPTELLNEVVGRLEPRQVALLAMAYDPSIPHESVTAAADKMGGYPLAVLRARLACKRALHDGAGIGFSELPHEPNLDLGPLPLYEAGRMTKESEETGFEKWMLTDMRLCKDIAEFGVFAQAIRAGALRGAAAAAPKRPAKGSNDSRAVPTLTPARLAGLGLALLVAAAAWLLFGQT